MITLQESHRAVFYAPFYAALARGAFAAEGVEVKFVGSPPTPAQALDELLTGAVDVGWGGPMRVNFGNLTITGADFVCFGEVVTRDPFFLVTKTDRGRYAPAALAGLRVGAVSEVPTPWLCLQHDLRLAGMDPDAVGWVKGRSMAQNAAGLLAGDIDVAQMYQPYVEELIDAGCEVWHAQASRGPCSYTTFYARRGVIAARRVELVAMLRGLWKTQQHIGAMDGHALAAIVAPYFPSLKRVRLAAALDRYMALGVWGKNPILPRGGYDRLRDSLVTGGLIERCLAFEDAVDNSLAHEAMAG
jgi:NitT/TauT family transport system substrate-binding protein